MSLKNRRISCEIRKAIQEKQYEPYEVKMSIEGDVPDKDNLEEELDDLYEFLDFKVLEKINKYIQ